MRELPPPVPSSLPYEPKEENLAKLEDWIFARYLSSSFNICEQQPLPLMDTSPPVKLIVEEGSEPVACTKASPIPINWLDKIKEELDKDVRLGVIAPVPENVPVTWCSRMGIVPKKSGEPRRVIDFRPLNKVTKSQTHPVESPFIQASRIPPGTWKRCSDAWNRYHSVPLDPESRHFTTFLTPFGRFWYLVNPQGQKIAGDAYSQRYDNILLEFE